MEKLVRYREIIRTVLEPIAVRKYSGRAVTNEAV